jgi:hypothetical protein
VAGMRATLALALAMALAREGSRRQRCRRSTLVATIRSRAATSRGLAKRRSTAADTAVRPMARHLTAVLAVVLVASCGSVPSPSVVPSTIAAAPPSVVPSATQPTTTPPSPSPTTEPAPIFGRVIDPSFADPLGDLTMTAVARGGPGLVAVGSGPLGAAVWTSPDGLAWTRVPDAPSFHGAPMAAVAGGSHGLVAVGPDVAWRSTDGRAWQRSPSPPRLGTDDPGQPISVVGWRDGYVAVGQGDDDDIWRSADGLRWRPAALDPEAEPDDGLSSVATDGNTLVAIGPSTVFVSADASAWQDATPDGDVAFDSVVARPGGGFVVIGQSDDTDTLAAWTSPDGVAWSQADSDAFANTDVSTTAWAAVASDGSSLVALAQVGPAMRTWRTRDGQTWSDVPVSFPGPGGTGPVGLVAFDGTLVAAGGQASGDWLPARAAVWLSPPPQATGIDLVPGPAECAHVPATVAAIVQISPTDRARCFGGRTLRLEGWVRTTPWTGNGASCPDPTDRDLGVKISIAAIGCIQVSPRAGDDIVSIKVAIAPGRGLREPPPDGHLYVLTGHFGDPAAARGCAAYPSLLPACSGVFVVTTYSVLK